MTNTEYIEGFRRQLKLKGLAKSSVVAYIGSTNTILRYINKDISDIKREDIIAYLEFMIDKEHEPTTIHAHVQSFQLFFRYLTDNHGVTNIAERLPRPKIKKKEKKVILDNKFQDAFDACQLEFKCYITMGYEQTMRIGEILKLELEDLDFEENTMHIRDAKRGSRRPPIGYNTKDVLLEWIRVNNITEGKLFNRSSKSVGDNFAKIFEKVGLKWGRKYDCTFHSLKHSGITFMIHNNVDVQTVSDICGTGVKVINEVYLHSTKESKSNAVNVFSKKRGEAIG